MNVKKYIQIVLSILLVFIAVSGGVLTARFLVDPFTIGEHGDALDVLDNKRVNILLLGTDAVGANTDVIMVVSIDSRNDKINIMSIPRDTRVKMGKSYHKINSAYAYAMNTGLKKEEFVINTVSDVSDLPIHHYAIIDLAAFREIVDALGGVDYEVTRDYNYYDPTQNFKIDIKKGFQTLNGTNAEGLVRFRGDYVRGDIERIEVQQQFIQVFLSQKLNSKYISKIPKVYESLNKNVVSDLSVNDIMKYGKTAVKIGKENVNILTLPGDSKYIGDTSYFVKDDAKTKQIIDTQFGYGTDSK